MQKFCWIISESYRHLVLLDHFLKCSSVGYKVLENISNHNPWFITQSKYDSTAGPLPSVQPTSFVTEFMLPWLKQSTNKNK